MGSGTKTKNAIFVTSDVAGNFPIASDQSEEMEQSCTGAC